MLHLRLMSIMLRLLHKVKHDAFSRIRPVTLLVLSYRLQMPLEQGRSLSHGFAQRWNDCMFEQSILRHAHRFSLEAEFVLKLLYAIQELFVDLFFCFEGLLEIFIFSFLLLLIQFDKIGDFLNLICRILYQNLVFFLRISELSFKLAFLEF